jgi:hypothetical protein
MIEKKPEATAASPHYLHFLGMAHPPLATLHSIVVPRETA